MAAVKFEELEVVDQFVSAGEGEAVMGYQKKSASSALGLEGGVNGELVIIKGSTTQFSKKAPVIKIEA